MLGLRNNRYSKDEYLDFLDDYDSEDITFFDIAKLKKKINNELNSSNQNDPIPLGRLNGGKTAKGKRMASVSEIDNEQQNMDSDNEEQPNNQHFSPRKLSPMVGRKRNMKAAYKDSDESDEGPEEDAGDDGPDMEFHIPDDKD